MKSRVIPRLANERECVSFFVPAFLSGSFPRMLGFSATDDAMRPVIPYVKKNVQEHRRINAVESPLV